MAMATDFSTGALPSVNTGLANFQRHWFGQFLTGTNEAVKEDYVRSEESADRQLQRDLYMQSQANQFNAEQAQLDRDFQERMANTQYLRAAKQMEELGINPIMMLNQLGGAASPQGAQASASGARSGGSNYHHSAEDKSGAVLGALLHLIGGLVTGLSPKQSVITKIFKRG